MANRHWLEQLNHYVVPLMVVGIGAYGAWDLVIRPFVRFEQPAEVCLTTLTDVAVLKPSAKPDQPPKRIQAPKGLPIIVPAGESRLLSIGVDNPDEKPVMYQWRATYGQFTSRITTENQSEYAAPRSLINDTVTVEASVQGCSAAKRTIEFAIVPSAKVPLSDQPLPNLPTQPNPTSTIPPALPPIDPRVNPTLNPTPNPTFTPFIPPR